MSHGKLNFMQRNIVKMFALALAGFVTSNAMASYITYETRQTNAGVNQSDYRASWNQQTSSISSTSLNQFSSIRASGSYRHSHLQVEFDTNSIQDLIFQFAPDAGLGGALYANNELVHHLATDLWWGYNWGRSNEILSASGMDFTMGVNVIDLYWAERCCDGGQSGRFSLNGGQSWMSLSTANLESMSVSEPGMLVLLASGLFGIALARRKQS